MAFEVHPHAPGAPPTDPLVVGPGATTFTTVGQLTGPSAIAGAYPKMMFIRVALFGTSPAPTLFVKAGAGTAKEVTTVATAVLRGAGLVDYVGDVQLVTAGELPNVWQVRVGFDKDTTETWQLGIRNNDAAEHEFTWVVAGSAAETAQPWIAVSPAELVITSLVNRTGETSLTIDRSVQVANKGTGPLTVTALTPALSAPLAVTTALPLPVQPGRREDLVVRFTPPEVPGKVTASATVTASPVDTTAGTAAGHNQGLHVTASAQRLEVALLLDASGSMTTDALGRLEPANSPRARWGELVSAANPFLDLLAHFGAGRGTFGIARFPGTDPNNPSTFDLVPKADITATVGPAQTAIAGVRPSGGTPMGDGLFRVLSGTRYFSNDVGNRRWLILMSDGAHNSGTHNPAEFTVPAAGTASLDDRGISLFGVAYGIEGHTDVNHTLLKELATVSEGGGHFRAVATEKITATSLAGALRDTLKSGLTAATSPLDPTGVFVFGRPDVRHEVVLTRFDSRAAFVLSWNTPNARRLRLELIAPGCRLITPENAGRGEFAGVTFRGGDRSHMYLVEPEFLRGRGGSSGRDGDGDGTWTLVVTTPEVVIGGPEVAATQDSETYVYDVIVDSGLRVELSQDRSTHFAGDPITLSARITADGRPVRSASVSVSTIRPAQSFANWLAALQVPERALEEARQQLADRDHTPLLVKEVAAGIAGLTFDGGSRAVTVPMTDPGDEGVYRATFTDTSVPEHHTFYVTATGVTDDGVSFRREGKQETYVLVRPDPAFTRLDIQELRPGLSQVTAIPRDRFGNVLLVDPVTAGGFAVTATGGQAGALTSGLDGTYTTTVTFDPREPVTIGLQHGGVHVAAPARTVPLADLQYPDQVIDVALGPIEAANQHADARAALGNVGEKPPDRFVSLGAGGTVVLGFLGKAITAEAEDDVTVFVAQDRDRRSFRVEALSPATNTWVELGTSVGNTQSFGLRKAGLESAPAIRISDTSGRTRDDALRPLATPGVSVRGVGVLRTVPSASGALPPWPIVQRGHREHPVRTLQHLLRARGHTVAVDGIFGPKTDAAVRAFQREKGLQVDGDVGPITWPALVVTVRRGSQGDAVRGVQEEFRFRDLSGDPITALPVDGAFGPRTEAAVRGFQEAVAADVADFPVDGIVGPKTWQALISGMLAL